MMDGSDGHARREKMIRRSRRRRSTARPTTLRAAATQLLLVAAVWALTAAAAAASSSSRPPRRSGSGGGGGGGTTAPSLGVGAGRSRRTTSSKRARSRLVVVDDDGGDDRKERHGGRIREATSSCRRPERSSSTVVAARGGGTTSEDDESRRSTAAVPRGGASSAALEGLKNSLASGLAAGCSKALLAPFDTIKTVQQNAITGGKAMGFGEALRTIVSRRPGGALNLYAGLGVSALGSMPSVGLYFGVYSYSKRVLGTFLMQRSAAAADDEEKEKDDGGVSVETAPRRPPGGGLSDGTLRTLTVAASAAIGMLLYLQSGAFALLHDSASPVCVRLTSFWTMAASAAIGNTVASFSRVPYEVVKQKLQTGEYATTLSAVTSMFRTGGMRAFFPTGGVSIQMVRDIPYAIFTLLAYERLREVWVVPRTERAVRDGKEAQWWLDMTAGAAAGGFGSYLTNPLDVIKTRMQTDTDGVRYGGSIWNCAQSTFDEGGPMAFLRGSVPRLMHKIPANGAFFVFYELFRRLLRVEDAGGGSSSSSKGDEEIES